MARVFISYARADLALAEPIRDALIEAGFDAYLDIHDIKAGDPWRDRLAALIAMAEKIVFLISPDSVASDICAWEVDEAERQGKSILPVMLRETPLDAIPGRLTRLHFIFARTEEERPKGLAQLTDALSTDLAWEREKTRINDLAETWSKAGRPRSRLLWRDDAIRETEIWRDAAPDSAPPPTEVQRRFIAASRQAYGRRTRRILSAAVVVAIVTLGLAGVAYWQRQEALASQATAEANAEAAEQARAAEAEQRAEAEAQRDQAERNFTTAERAINSLIFDIAQDLENIEGVSIAALRRILGQSEAALDALLADDPDNPRLLRSKAAALTKFGDVYARSGEADAALAAYEEGLAIGRALLETEPGSIQFQRDVSLSLNRVGDLRLRRGEADAASAAYEEGLQIRRALARAEPENVQARTDVVVSLVKVSAVVDGDRQRAALEEALGLARALEAEGLLSADQAEWPALLEAQLRRLGAE